MQLKSVETLEKSQAKLTICVEKDEFNEGLETAYRKNVKRINMPGFRKGKAPRKMIERMYGESFFYEDAVNACYPKAYQQAADESGLDIVGSADVDIVSIDADGFVFEATVDVRPVAEIGTYKGLKAESKPVVVSDEEIEADIERMRARNARVETVDRPAQNGDTVVMDYAGFANDKQFEGGTAQNHSLELGSNSFIPGFEEQLIGVSAGEEKDVNVTFPDPYHSEELAGQPAVFKVTVHEVKAKSLPELDDEFAKDVSELDTLAELRAQIKEDKVKQREREVEQAIESQLLDALLLDFKAFIPESMIESATEHIMEDFNYQLMSQGIDFQTYMSITGMDREKLTESFRSQAEHNVKANLALSRVADLENVEITDEQVEEKMAQMAADYKVEIDKIRDMVKAATLKRDMRVQAAMKIVRENAEITEATDEKPTKKPTKAKKAEPKADEAAAEEKPAPKKKAAPKTTTAKATTAKPKAADKPAAEKKPAAKKAAKETE